MAARGRGPGCAALARATRRLRPCTNPVARARPTAAPGVSRHCGERTRPRVRCAYPGYEAAAPLHESRSPGKANGRTRGFASVRREGESPGALRLPGPRCCVADALAREVDRVDGSAVTVVPDLADTLDSRRACDVELSRRGRERDRPGRAHRHEAPGTVGAVQRACQVLLRAHPLD